MAEEILSWTQKYQESSKILALAWAEFEREFPTDEAVNAEIVRRIREEKLSQCGACVARDLERLDGCRTVLCLNCKGKTELTLGTVFYGAKRPKAWLGAIWLKEKGYNFSAHKLSRLADISYSSAWNLRRRLSTPGEFNVASQPPSKPPEISTTINSITLIDCAPTDRCAPVQGCQMDYGFAPTVSIG